MKLQQPFGLKLREDYVATGKPYKFKTTAYIEFEVTEFDHGHPPGDYYRYHDEKGRDWLLVFYDEPYKLRLVIVPNYAWDGATMAPDYPEVILPSLLHDALCQFRKTPGFPFTKKQVDGLFLESMRKQGFCLAEVYYAAVRAFGWLPW